MSWRRREAKAGRKTQATSTSNHAPSPMHFYADCTILHSNLTQAKNAVYISRPTTVKILYRLYGGSGGGQTSSLNAQSSKRFYSLYGIGAERGSIREQYLVKINVSIDGGRTRDDWLLRPVRRLVVVGGRSWAFLPVAVAETVSSRRNSGGGGVVEKREFWGNCTWAKGAQQVSTCLSGQ